MRCLTWERGSDEAGVVVGVAGCGDHPKVILSLANAPQAYDVPGVGGVTPRRSGSDTAKM